MLKKRWFLMALLAFAAIIYIAANVFDYRYTLYGITHGVSSEGNPITQRFIELFGLKKGLQLSKTIFVGFILAGALLIEIEYCRKKKLAFPTTISCWVLCLGTALTLLAVIKWLRLLSP